MNRNEASVQLDHAYDYVEAASRCVLDVLDNALEIDVDKDDLQIAFDELEHSMETIARNTPKNTDV
jgi:predicted ATP-grasp superfamily ATP-dependent carboligase